MKREVWVSGDQQCGTRSASTDRLQALAALTGGFAHDFNNLLTVIRGAAELAQRLPAAEAATQLRAIAETADRAATLTQHLLAFAQRQPLRAVAVDLAVVLTGVRDEIARSAAPDVRIRLLLSSALPPVLADSASLTAALATVWQNALEAMADGGVLTLSAAPVSGPSGELVRVTIADSGIGMTADVAERAFDPFFTTKALGASSGLGLAHLHGFVAQSGGRVEIESAPGRGTAVVIHLPVAAAGPALRDVATFAPEEGTRVLLVEDSNTVAAFAEALLTDMGCQVTRTACAAEALAALADTSELYDIMFSDIVMPGMSGLDLAARVRDQHPSLPILLATGHSDQVVCDGSAFPILPKPYRRESLARMMGSVMMAA